MHAEELHTYKYYKIDNYYKNYTTYYINTFKYINTNIKKYYTYYKEYIKPNTNNYNGCIKYMCISFTLYPT